MAMPVAQKTVLEDSRICERGGSSPGSTRGYARGQQVRVRIRNGEWRNGHVVDFGNQEILPLYWVKIDGSAREAFKFEFELRPTNND